MKDQNKIAVATLKQMENDQRAWLIPEVPTFDGEPTPQVVRFNIRVKNHGTKPAVFSHHTSAWEPFFWGPKGVGLGSKTTFEQIYRRLYEGEVHFAQSAIVAPGETYDFLGIIEGPGEEAFKEIFSKSDKHMPAVFSRIVYYSAGGKECETIRSFLYNHEKKKLEPCPIFNDLR